MIASSRKILTLAESYLNSLRVPENDRIKFGTMTKRKPRSRPTVQLVELAQERFYGCFVCRRKDSFDFADDVLGPLRLRKGEHARLFRSLTCPGCDSRIWPGSLVLAADREQIWHTAQSKKFDRLHKLELEDFRAFLIRHPMLGAQHKFGQMLSRAVVSSKRTNLQPRSWYHAAKPSTVKFTPREPETMTKAYRFNFIGQGACYLADDARTAAVEVLRRPQAHVKLTVATVEVLETLRVLDLRGGLWGESPSGNWILREVVDRRFVSEPTRDEDDSRPQYRVPQFVADLARRHGFRGILYDCTRPSPYNNSEASGYNLVLFHPYPQSKVASSELMEIGDPETDTFSLDRWPIVPSRS